MSWRWIGVLAALLVAALVAWVVQPGPRPPTTPTAGRVFQNLVHGDITEIRVDVRTGEHSPMLLHARRVDRGWELLAPLPDEADTQAIETLVHDVVKLGYTRRLEGGAEPAHGFDPPAIAITANRTEGPPIVLRLGAAASMELHVYAQVEGQPDVFIVPGDIASHCRKPAWSFRNKRVMGILSSDAMEVRLLGAGGSANPVVLRRQGDGTWRQVAPVGDRANLDLVMEFLGRVHLDCQAKRFVDATDGKAPALQPHGLDRPFLEIEVTGSQGSTETVSYGTASTDWQGHAVPGLFAYRHRDRRIFECEPEHLEPLQRAATPVYFRERGLLELAAPDLDRISVTAPAGAHEWQLSREGQVWSLTKPRPLKCFQLRPEAVLTKVPELRASGFTDGLPAGGLAALGLDPAQRWRVEFGAKDQAEALWLGAETRDGQRYVAREGSGRVYTVAAPPTRALLGDDRGWLSLVDRQVWDIGAGREQGTLRITVRDDAGETTRVWTQTLGPSGVVHWRQADGAAAADGNALTAVCDSFAGLYATQWLVDGPTEADLRQAGLAEPRGPDGWRIRVEAVRTVPGSAPTTATLWIGRDHAESGSQGESTPRHLFRVTPALQGDMIGAIRTGLGDAIRELMAR